MMQDLNGKVAVVTGAARGIGAALARELAAEGARVVVADIDEQAAQAVAAEIEATGAETLAVACDIGDVESVEALADTSWSRFGTVDVLVNNAGVLSAPSPLIEIEERDARWVLEINVLGTWHGCSVFGRRFVAQGTPAHILNTGSENCFGAPVLGSGMYTASKHAILGLSDVLRRELPDYVGVSILCPGGVATELTGATLRRPTRFGGPDEPVYPKMTGGMTPEEVARRAVAGLKNGDFYIVTHAPTIGLAEERWQEVEAAFAAQAPLQDGEERRTSAQRRAEGTPPHVLDHA
jgi:NAD(P)-dependent dehydrogenase (short-subunit alcohol dehydrogenase family)